MRQNEAEDCGGKEVETCKNIIIKWRHYHLACQGDDSQDMLEIHFAGIYVSPLDFAVWEVVHCSSQPCTSDSHLIQSACHFVAGVISSLSE